MDFAPVYAHDPIEQIADDVFMARGGLKLNPIIKISRNMAIVRRGDELTLVNPIRLSEAELRRLDALGTVRHIIRLGAFHGLDDPFYMARYRPTFWCQAGGSTYPEPPIDHVLTEDNELPIDNAKLFCFRNTNQPECALLLATGGGLLLTCDAIQHYGDYSNNNMPARMIMPFIGFPKTTLIGPVWLKLMTPKGATLRSEFERLFELEFDSLLSAHGTLLDTGAGEAVHAAIARAFPS